MARAASPQPSTASFIGSHVTVTGGLATGGLAYAADVGAEVVQVFVSNPRGWAALAANPAEDAALRDSGIPVFIHAPYLINLGSADAVLAARSAEALGYALTGVPFVAETPGGKAAHARDIALLKDLRAVPCRAV